MARQTISRSPVLPLIRSNAGLVMLALCGMAVAVGGSSAAVEQTSDAASDQPDNASEEPGCNDCTFAIAAKLMIPDGAAGDQFGFVTALSGSTVVVGAPRDDHDGINTGSAFVFENDGSSWVQVAQLNASDAADRDQFGYSMAIDRDILVVGAPFDQHNGETAGAVYVFERENDEWAQTHKLIASDVGFVDTFGLNVSVSGNVIAVGAPFRTDDAENPEAAVYIFEKQNNTWLETAILTGSDDTDLSRFGRSLELAGAVLIVGASEHSGAGTAAGAAYVFERNGDTWLETAKLVGSDTEENDSFGLSVATSGNMIAIGAAYDDEGTGAVYVFERNGEAWTQSDKLVAAGGTQQHGFGFRVAIDNDTLVSSAPFDGDVGASYSFARQGGAWVEGATAAATDAGHTERFGVGFALDGPVLAIGDFGDDEMAADAGAVYVLEMRPASKPSI